MKKHICILTKSLKDREYCVAGVDVTNGENRTYNKFVAKILI